jgi:hypothetical protein
MYPAQNSTSAQVSTPTSNTTVNASKIIAELSGVCESRFHAISYYPNSYGAKEKFKAIEKIRYELQSIKLMLVPRMQIIECLRLELSFHKLAGSPTRKLHHTYMAKVNGLFDACRMHLGRTKQW